MGDEVVEIFSVVRSVCVMQTDLFQLTGGVGMEEVAVEAVLQQLLGHRN